MAKKNIRDGASFVGGGTALSSTRGVSASWAGGGAAEVELFRSLADHSQEFIGMCDLEFKPFYVNEAGRRLVGLASLEEACAVKVQEFFFPEDQRFITEEFFPKVLKEGACEVEIRFRHFKTGAAVWMIYNVFQVRDAQGRASGYATGSRDITERKRAEEAIRSVALFPEQNPFPVLRVDREGKLLFANRASAELLAEWQWAVGESVQDQMCERVRSVLAGEKAEKLEASVGGRTVSFVLMPISDEGYVNLYGRDVTEQKLAEEQLRKSEQRYEGLFQDDLTGDFISTPEGRVLLCNPAFASIFGFSSVEEAVGTSMRELYLDPGEREALVEQVKQRRKVEHFEAWRKRRDGTAIHVVENLVGHFDERGELFEIKGYIFDDTNRKRAEETVRERAEELRAVLDTAPVAVWIAQDRECRVITGNEYADELIMQTARGGNISRSAAPGEAAVSYRVFRDGAELGPEDLPAQRATATARPVPAFEMELVFPNDRRLNLLAGAVPLFDGEGKVRGAIVAGLDVTQLKKAQEELRLAEERARFALEAGRMGTWDRVMPDGPTVWNEDHYRILGYDPAQLTASKEAWEARVHPRDLPAFYESISGVLKEGGDFDEEMRIVWPGGEVRWVELRGSIQCDASGRPKRSCGVVLDLTERKRAEQLGVLEDVFRLAPSFLHVLRGPKFVFEFANEAYYGLVGHRELIGKPAFEAMPEAAEGGYPERIARVMATGEAFLGRELPVTLARTPGAKPEERIIDLVYLPLKDADGTCTGVLGHGTDVTEHVRERRRVEEALRQSEQQFRLMGETVPFGVWLCAPNGGVRYCSESFLELINMTQEEQQEFGWTKRLVPEDVEPMMRKWLGCCATGEPWEHEHRIIDRNGAIHTILSKGLPVRDGEGKITCWTGVNLDITARKAVEGRLRESEGRYRSLFESMTEGFALHEIITDEQERPVDYRFLDVNPAFEQMTGLRRAEVLGKRVREVLPAIEALWMENYGRVALAGEPVHFESYARPLGRWYEVFAYCPAPRQFAVVFMDITTRKCAEEALRESEEHFRSITDTTPVIMWMTDANGMLEFVNRAYCEFFGVRLEEVARPGGWQPLVHPEDADSYVGAYMEALRSQSEFRAEGRVRRGDGEWRWVQSYGAPRFDEQGEFLGMAGSSPDITERKEFQAELQRLVDERTAKLQELVGELEHFSYTITHDLKSPLRAMRGFAEVIKEIGVESEAKPFLEKISAAAERMDHLIADALSYSRSVRQELPLEEVDAAALLRGMLDSYPELQPDKARIVVEGRLPVVLANEAGLTQCFSNLLGNAVKFVKPGEKPDIRMRAEVLAQGHGAHGKHSGWVRIWVEDKGIGIGKEMLPRVFDMFARGSKDYEGTGIGLALVRKVVQRMGGKVGVESEEGKGSRFWIDLTKVEARPAFGGASAFARASGERAARPGTVLYVEDEESDATFMQRAFEGKGMAGKLRVVGDGRAAMDYLSGAGDYGDREEYPVPALVLLDLNLPQIGGFQVLEWIRNNPDYARMPVVMFSSSTREDDRVRARELGADEFVAKPSSGLKFGEVVEELRAKWHI